MKRILKYIGAAILIWTAITSTVYRFKHPEKTEIQAFLHIPKSFILNFK